MADSDKIIEYIKQSDAKFSKSQKKIAEYITAHYDTAAFMTAAKLGSVVNVSESTVVRFASELGYEGYPEFQRALQEHIKTRLTSVQKVEIISSKIEYKDVLREVINSDIDKLRRTVDTISGESFECAVDMLANAKSVYIMGTRTCSSIASFMGVYLNLILNDVRIVTANSASDVYEQMYRISSEDVLIAISYPRYSQRTFNCVKFAEDRGAKVLAITDSEVSPIVKSASCSLIARCDMSNFVDSLVAPLSLVNALIVALVIKNKEKAVGTFDSLEEIWEKYHVYRGFSETNTDKYN